MQKVSSDQKTYGSGQVAIILSPDGTQVARVTMPTGISSCTVIIEYFALTLNTVDNCGNLFTEYSWYTEFRVECDDVVRLDSRGSRTGVREKEVTSSDTQPAGSLVGLIPDPNFMDEATSGIGLLTGSNEPVKTKATSVIVVYPGMDGIAGVDDTISGHMGVIDSDAKEEWGTSTSIVVWVDNPSMLDKIVSAALPGVPSTGHNAGGVIIDTTRYQNGTVNITQLEQLGGHIIHQGSDSETTGNQSQTPSSGAGSGASSSGTNNPPGPQVPAGGNYPL